MHPRSEWNAQPARSRQLLHDPLALTVHWEGVGVGLSDPAEVPAVVLAIQRYHMAIRDLVDIAYNFLVDPWGEVWEGRGGGVKSGANGTNYANSHHLAVCVLHGPGDPPLRPVVFTAVACLRDLYCLPLRRHSDEKPTACPGPELSAWVPLNAQPNPHSQPPEEAMPHLMLRDTRPEGSIWAVYDSGQIVHLGGGAFGWYLAQGVPLVDCAVATNEDNPHAEADRLKALAG